MAIGQVSVSHQGLQIDGAPKKSKTRALDVFERLQADILHCNLEPGRRLRLKEIQAKYETGLSPLREALMRLAADGLVVLEDHKGFRVAPVSRSEFIDVAHTRSQLEAIAVRMAIERADDHWEATLLARFHELSKRPQTQPDGTPDPEWEIRHEAFHATIHAGSGSRWLAVFCGKLCERSRRYRRLSARIQTEGSQRNVAAEHEAILKAVLARDASKAEALMREHLERTSHNLLEHYPDLE